MELNLATGRQKVKRKKKLKTRRPAVQEKSSVLFLVLLIAVEDVLNRRPEILLVLRRGNFQQRLVNKFITWEFFITQQ
jgi:hypothetical protein